jgi:preprotein translocase subunit SecG
MDFDRILNVAQVLVSIAVITVVLLQAKGRGLGTGMGGAMVHTRRGVEKTIFNLTIVLGTLFVIVSAVSVAAAR